MLFISYANINVNIKASKCVKNNEIKLFYLQEKTFPKKVMTNFSKMLKSMLSIKILSNIIFDRLLLSILRPDVIINYFDGNDIFE